MNELWTPTISRYFEISIDVKYEITQISWIGFTGLYTLPADLPEFVKIICGLDIICYIPDKYFRVLRVLSLMNFPTNHKDTLSLKHIFTEKIKNLWDPCLSFFQSSPLWHLQCISARMKITYKQFCCALCVQKPRFQRLGAWTTSFSKYGHWLMRSG